MIDSSHNPPELEVVDQGQMEWKTGGLLKRDFSVLVMITLLAHPAEKSGGCTQPVCRTSSFQGTLRSIHPQSPFLQEQRQGEEAYVPGHSILFITFRFC